MKVLEVRNLSLYPYIPEYMNSFKQGSVHICMENNYFLEH